MKHIQHISFAALYRFRWIRLTLVTILVIAAFIAVFDAGQSVGFRKANFACGVGGRYNEMFERRGDSLGGRAMNMRMMPPPPDAHGAVGEVVKIEGLLLTVATPDNFEKNIRVTETTLIRRFRDSITVGDIAVGDRVVVIGSPNTSSEIEARLVRVMPKESEKTQ